MRETFASARLAMRPFVASDAEPLFAGYGSAEAMRWWSTPPHVDAEQTRAYLVGTDEDDEEIGEDAWQGWAVARACDKAVIGTLSAGQRRAGVFEVGYLLSPAHQGQGYGREMVAALIAILFADERARRIYADVDPDNAASIALLTDLGFQQEGRLRQAWDSHIGIRDALIYGLLRDEWRRVDSVTSR